MSTVTHAESLAAAERAEHYPSDMSTFWFDDEEVDMEDEAEVRRRTDAGYAEQRIKEDPSMLEHG